VPKSAEIRKILVVGASEETDRERFKESCSVSSRVL
jgi:hypothetical protein